MEFTKYTDIIEKTDIKNGDIIDVSSDLEKFMLRARKYKEKFDPDRLINSIQDRVGYKGTILIRTWNWDFCHGEPFDYYNTPSRVGALGNVALKRKDFIRTKHPLYSYAVWGKYAKELSKVDNISAFGEDSPFGFLTRNNGKQLMLGSTMFNSFTYVHYVEEKVGVKYRYQKKFTGKYIDADGVEYVKTYTMNVRDLDLDIKMNSEKFIEDFYDCGALKTWDFSGISVSTVDLQKTYKIVEDDILNNSSRKICSYIKQ